MATSRTVIAALAFMGAAVAAHAADMPRTMDLPPPPMMQRAPALVEDYSSGWYLRGDVGYRLNRVGSATASGGFPDPTSNSLKKGFMFGGGAGFKAGWVRADITGDFSPAVKYTGRVVAPGDVSAKVSAATGLFNLYFDLGTWYGFTPYAGAGLGAAWLRTSDFQSAVIPPFTGGATTNSRWNIAWAAMAGVSYGFTQNLFIDAGYRYLNMGSARSIADAFGSTTLKQVAAHEFRVGVRWMFNDSFPIP